MKSLFLVLALLVSNAFAMEEMTDGEMSNVSAKGFDILDDNRIDTLGKVGIVFPLLMPVNIQFVKAGIEGNNSFTILAEGGIQYEMPYIDELYYKNMLGFDWQIKGLDMRGTIVQIIPHR